MRIVVNITSAFEIITSGTPIFLDSENIKETILPYFHQIVTKMKILTIIVTNVVSVILSNNNINLRELVEWIVLEVSCFEQP